MNFRIEIKPAAFKEYSKFPKETRSKIKTELLKLEQLENPLSHPKVKPLVGPLKGDFRLRVGDVRVLFTMLRKQKLICVYAILKRDKAYDI
ncbi:MAG: type II toxin-antitoxin system RelE/ParE family toxin [Candidatus Wallbacteria bacterium]|nr:type II toxin-antitoxin system RelE/ParE family toxin [Candidatus Wallbacteria bacterium]